MSERKTAWAEVDRSAIRHNLALVRQQLKAGTKICAVLKGNAYGHDLIKMEQFLTSEGLVDMLAVGKPDELAALTEQTGIRTGSRLPVLLLGEAEADEVENLLLHKQIDPERVILSIFSLRQYRALRDLAERLGIRLLAHVRVDEWNSGMGLGYESFLAHEETFFSSASVKICGLYAHLYSSYFHDPEKTGRDLADFDAFVRKISPSFRERLTVHVQNSALIFDFPEYAYDMARAGAALYGLPCGDRKALRPALRICSRVFSVRDVPVSVPLAYHPAEDGEGSEGSGAPGSDCEAAEGAAACVAEDSEGSGASGSACEAADGAAVSTAEGGNAARADGDGGHKRTRRIARLMIGYGDCPLLFTARDVRAVIGGRSFRLADEICMDNLCLNVSGAEHVAPGDIAVFLGEGSVTYEKIMARNEMAYVHSDWLCMTAGRLEKIFV